jgi:ferredoxin-NADP reductase
MFAFAVNPKGRSRPVVVRKEKITPNSADFVLAPDKKFNYLPGQYMEFTLPHEHIDSRGQRRYFSLASSPTEDNLRIGVKFYKQGSSFKKAMLAMGKKSAIVAANLGGDFVLPNDTSKKIVLIAGGIGITPYRSMVKFLLDTNERRTLTLLYGTGTAKEIAYKGVFDDARLRLGIKALYVLSKESKPPGQNFRTGRIDGKLIKSEVPDFAERLFYISGPHGMVSNVEAELKAIGVPHSRIKTDLFSGYA